MWRITGRAFSHMAFAAAMLAAAAPGRAEETPRPHHGPWPIHHWHQLQPRGDQLTEMHVEDVTPQEARKVEQLYWQLEAQTPSGAVDCDTKSIPRHDRDRCLADARARVLPSRPVPNILASPH